MSTDSPRIPHRGSTGYKRDSVNRALDRIVRFIFNLYCEVTLYTCDLVRPRNIILRYSTMLGIASIQVLEHQENSQLPNLGVFVARLHTIYRRWSAITVIYLL